MIHYTPLPLEDVFDGWDRPRQEAQEVVVNGVTMVVEPVNMKEAKIVRIISSDPQDYLNPAFQPGKMVAFMPFSE